MGYRPNTVSVGTIIDISDELVASIFKAEVAENIAQTFKYRDNELTRNVGICLPVDRLFPSRTLMSKLRHNITSQYYNCHIRREIMDTDQAAVR